MTLRKKQGYKHYVRNTVPTLFSFGHGLSYTTFDITDLVVSNPSGLEMSFVARVRVQNTGGRPGSEVVQIYVTPCSESKATHPVRSLRGYGRTHELAPGESVNVEVKLDKLALSYWNAPHNSWRLEKGQYTVIVGRCADDVLLSQDIEVTKEQYWNGL